MDRNVMAKILHVHEGRFAQVDQQLQTLFKVLQEIVSKELMRGQALHKVLMDKGLFTDEDLSKALKSLMEEAQADLKKAEAEVKEEKQKAVEILIPAGANVQSKQPEAPSLAPVDPTPAGTTPTDPMPTNNPAEPETTNVQPPESA